MSTTPMQLRRHVGRSPRLPLVVAVLPSLLSLASGSSEGLLSFFSAAFASDFPVLPADTAARSTASDKPEPAKLYRVFRARKKRVAHPTTRDARSWADTSISHHPLAAAEIEKSAFMKSDHEPRWLPSASEEEDDEWKVSQTHRVFRAKPRSHIPPASKHVRSVADQGEAEEEVPTVVAAKAQVHRAFHAGRSAHVDAGDGPDAIGASRRSVSTAIGASHASVARAQMHRSFHAGRSAHVDAGDGPDAIGAVRKGKSAIDHMPRALLHRKNGGYSSEEVAAMDAEEKTHPELMDQAYGFDTPTNPDPVSVPIG